MCSEQNKSSKKKRKNIVKSAKSPKKESKTLEAKVLAVLEFDESCKFADPIKSVAYVQFLLFRCRTIVNGHERVCCQVDG